MEGVEGLALGFGKRWERGRAWSGGCAGDAGAGAVDENAGGFGLGEDQGTCVKGFRRRWTMEKSSDVSRCRVIATRYDK